MNKEVEQLLNDLENDINAISIESYTGGFEDRETAIETLKKLKLKLFAIPIVIERIEEYAPKKIELPEFDLTKKGDYIYCIEWGEKKAKRNEWEVYQKLLKELKEKYVL